MKLWKYVLFALIAIASSCSIQKQQPQIHLTHVLAVTHEGDTLKLDIDPKSHSAWTGQHRIMDSEGQVARFNKRFQNLNLKK